MTKIQIKSKIFVHLAGFLSFLITKGGRKDYPKASDCSDRENGTKNQRPTARTAQNSLMTERPTARTMKKQAF